MSTELNEYDQIKISELFNKISDMINIYKITLLVNGHFGIPLIFEEFIVKLYFKLGLVVNPELLESFDLVFLKSKLSGEDSIKDVISKFNFLKDLRYIGFQNNVKKRDCITERLRSISDFKNDIIPEHIKFELTESLNMSMAYDRSILEEEMRSNDVNTGSLFVMPDNVNTIPSNLFMNDPYNVKKLVTSENTFRIASRAFSNGKKSSDIVSFECNYPVERIGRFAFHKCKELKDFKLVCKEYSTLPNYTFFSCSSLTRIDIKDSNIRFIGMYCFCSCTALTDVFLPNDLIYLGPKCFYNTKIKKITIPGTCYFYTGDQRVLGLDSCDVTFSLDNKYKEMNKMIILNEYINENDVNRFKQQILTTDLNNLRTSGDYDIIHLDNNIDLLDEELSTIYMTIRLGNEENQSLFNLLDDLKQTLLQSNGIRFNFFKYAVYRSILDDMIFFERHIDDFLANRQNLITEQIMYESQRERTITP